MQRTTSGFTLIELMIVVAVIGILAAIAYPSYNVHIQKSHRSNAEAALLENAQFLERRYTVCNAYNRDPNDDCDPLNPLAAGDIDLPVQRTPRDAPAADARYNLTVFAIGANNFTLRATPVGVQATERCGRLTLFSTGARQSFNGVDGGPDCWPEEE